MVRAIPRDRDLAHSPSPILVTGMHRSGTSWVGHMLAAGASVRYIDEPLNDDHGPRMLRGIVTHWYQYICPENDQHVRPALTSLLKFRYHDWILRRGLKQPRDLLKAHRDIIRYLRHRAQPRPPLVKCPFCVFSIPWFVDQLGARVVVTLRDPLATVSSLKRLRWAFDFENLLKQPLLMRDALEPFRAPMRRCVDNPDDIVGHGILLWRMVYRTVAEYRQRYPQLILARHEDLSRSPIEGFRKLYAQLDLPFNPSAQRGISETSSTGNPSEAPADAPRQICLDSRANLESWRRRLQPAEIARVRAATADVAELFESRPVRSLRAA